MLTIRTKYKEGRSSYSKYKVYVDDKMVGMINDTNHFNKDLKPGNYNIYLKSGLFRTKKFNFEVKEEEYQLFLLYDDPKYINFILFIMFLFLLFFINNLPIHLIFKVSLIITIFQLEHFFRIRYILHKINK